MLIMTDDGLQGQLLNVSNGSCYNARTVPKLTEVWPGMHKTTVANVQEDRPATDFYVTWSCKGRCASVMLFVSSFVAETAVANLIADFLLVMK